MGRPLGLEIMNSIYTKDTLRYLGNIAEVGDYFYGTPSVWHWGEGAKLKIGKFCSFSWDINIFLGGEHRTDWITTYPFPSFFTEALKIKGTPTTKGNVIIGNDVWVGYGATILSGVKIGDGAVIGANTVVAKSIPPYSIAVGNPSNVTRKRFSDGQIEKLLVIKWWNWENEKIEENIPLLLSGQIDEFLEIHYKEVI